MVSKPIPAMELSLEDAVLVRAALDFWAKPLHDKLEVKATVIALHDRVVAWAEGCYPQQEAFLASVQLAASSIAEQLSLMEDTSGN